MTARTPQDTWTVQEALNWTVGYLSQKADEHPRRSAEWLLSAATGLSRVELYAYFDRPLSLEERAALREGVKRRGAGEPLQYVTGEVAFRHIVLRTAPGVLIPRPETEVLVDVGLEIVDAALASRGEARILDLCTGSGCIALSLLHERASVTAVATDLSSQAIVLAKRNAQALSLQDRITFFECDLAAALGQEYRHSFDLVISNPPYIPTAEVDTLSREVLDFEPRLALDGGVDGLDVFRRIIDIAPDYLRSGGALVCELHENTLSLAAQNCVQCYKTVEVVKDLTGRDRILRALST